MASYRQRGNKWSYRFKLSVPGEEKKKEIEVGGFATREMAELGYLEKYEPEKLETRSKFELYAYCKECFLTRNSKSMSNDKTTNDYIRILDNHIKKDVFGCMRIQHVTAKSIDEFYDRLSKGEILLRSGKTEQKEPVQNKTIQRIHRTLNIPFNHAFKYGDIKHANPFMIASTPEAIDTVYDTLTQKEVNHAFKQLKNIDELIVRAFFMLSALTGLRRGELAGLEWHSVDFINEWIVIRSSMSKQPTKYARIPIPPNVKNVYTIKPTKTNRERRFPMSDEVKSIFLVLREYHDRLEQIHPHWKDMIQLYSLDQDKRLAPPQTRDLVFRWENGDYLRPDYMTKRHKQFMQKEFPNKRLRLHDERHTYATNMLKANVPMHEIQVLIGHAKISTTIDQYGHVSGDDCRSSVEYFSQRFDVTTIQEHEEPILTLSPKPTGGQNQ